MGLVSTAKRKVNNGAEEKKKTQREYYDKIRNALSS